MDCISSRSICANNIRVRGGHKPWKQSRALWPATVSQSQLQAQAVASKQCLTGYTGFLSTAGTSLTMKSGYIIRRDWVYGRRQRILLNRNRKFLELVDRGPQDMIDIVTDKVFVKRGRTQKPGHSVHHRRTDCRYIITKRSDGSHQAGLAEHEQAAIAADFATLTPARFADVRRIVEAEAASRSKQPGEYSGCGWTPDWSLQSVLTDEHCKAVRAAKCLIVLDGLIGCGKTTFLRFLQKNGSEGVEFVAEPVDRNEPDTWWTDLEALYRVMAAGTPEQKIAATFKMEYKAWEHHFRVAAQRQMHTFTERGLGSTVQVFCKVCTEDGLLTEGQREYFSKAYEKYSSDEFLRPTLTLYFKLPTEEALARIQKRAREFEKGMPRPYLERLYCAYDEFLSNHEDVILVDSNNPPEDMMMEIAGKVEAKLRSRMTPQDLRSVMRCFGKVD
ncbi:unnamed protein product [Symbiodinium sp. CCMP2456]|nr:unnamed protein product [Symbiodinium sp. CCMP2456]